MINGFFIFTEVSFVESLNYTTAVANATQGMTSISPSNSSSLTTTASPVNGSKPQAGAATNGSSFISGVNICEY